MEKKITELVKNLIKQSFQKNFNCEIENIDLEKPNDINNGNLSTNICLKKSKELKKNPLVIGELLIENFEKNDYIKKVEVVKPGFLNFYFTEKYFSKLIFEINNEEFLKFPDKNKTINVEFVSANPTGKLHLGHARNGVFGDSLANVLEKIGYSITREYYINDAGVQMENLGLSVKAFYLELCGEKLIFPEKGYKGQEIKDIAKKMFENFGNTKADESLDFFINFGYEENMTEIKKLMNKLNIKFSHFASEKYYHENKLVESALKTLEEKGEIYNSEGAKWLATTKYLDDKDRVLQKSDGTHTYLTSDIAYHVDKITRGSELLIDVWGGDHHGYVARVKSAITALGYSEEQLEIVLIQMVSIFNGEEKIKMSKRAGTSVTIDDLLELISVDVLRYFFIMRSPDTQLDFNIEVATQENSDNPVFYIQYAHARINKIIEKAKEDKIIENKTIDNDIFGKYLTKNDLELIDYLSQYKKILNEAGRSRRPHIVANYLYDLSGAFHKYYNSEKILSSDFNTTYNKILICQGVQKIIADGLNLIGIEAKKSM